MKKYNIENYIRYKDDLKKSISLIEKKEFKEYSRDELIKIFLPLVENIAKKFSTSDQASGVMDITDLIQEGSLALTQAIDKIEWDKIDASNHKEDTIKAFIYKRIKGSIRRAVDINRGSIRIPECKLNELRRNPDNPNNQVMVEMFFNSIFQSIDSDSYDSDSDSIDSERSLMQYEDKSSEYNIDLINTYLVSLIKKHLSKTESEVLRLSYGLDCEKHSAKEIINKLGLKGNSAYVRVSEIKKLAISKLIQNVDSSQIIDLLN